jgi:hypothetical protein
MERLLPGVQNFSCHLVSLLFGSLESILKKNNRWRYKRSLECLKTCGAVRISHLNFCIYTSFLPCVPHDPACLHLRHLIVVIILGEYYELSFVM